MGLTLYNRLCGWFWIVLGVTGWNGGRVGDYLYLQPGVSKAYLALGMLAILGARSRRRYNAAVVTGVVTTLFAIGGILGITLVHSIFVPKTPLETLLRLLSALWGGYALIASIHTWMHTPAQEV
ncbi:hypothetical protein D2Q93_12270 [Alicyclobacillaceae bacterium I2511]|nr:hypothetical protein D2Q93_12270 [Alicyclobacillaceae bacterium I2511]